MSPDSKPRALDAYIRVSRVGGRAGESYITKRQQRDAIERWCGLQGYEIAQWHEEEDRSGGDASRPKWNEVKRRALAGETDGVIVAKLDRFARSVIDGLKAVTELDKAGRTFVSVAEKFDTADPYGRFTATIFFALAELELGRIKGGWNDAKRRAIERGCHIGPDPAGYTSAVTEHTRKGDPIYGPLVPNEDAAAILAAFELRAEGASLSRVTAHLTAAGVKTSRGSTRWSMPGAIKLLANEVYVGTIKHGEFSREDAHEPIVTRALFMAAQRKAEERARTRGPDSEGRLLSGMIWCASCRGRMTLDHQPREGGKYYTYRCRQPGCEIRTTVAATKVEQAIEQALRERLASEEFRIETNADEGGLGALRAELETVKRELEAWLETDMRVSPEAWQKRTAVLEERVKAAQAKLDDAEVEGLAPLPSLDKYDLLPLPLKREVVAAFLKATGLGRLAVKPGRDANRFVFLPDAA